MNLRGQGRQRAISYVPAASQALSRRPAKDSVVVHVPLCLGSAQNTWGSLPEGGCCVQKPSRMTVHLPRPETKVTRLVGAQ